MAEKVLRGQANFEDDGSLVLNRPNKPLPQPPRAYKPQVEKGKEEEEDGKTHEEVGKKSRAKARRVRRKQRNRVESKDPSRVNKLCVTPAQSPRRDPGNTGTSNDNNALPPGDIFEGSLGEYAREQPFGDEVWPAMEPFTVHENLFTWSGTQAEDSIGKEE
jgi:hypothetical protein